MHYHYQTTPDATIEYLSHTIISYLATNKRVVWLLSGGSNIGVATAVAQRLQSSDLSNLYVSLVDERYGPVGHADENWEQLINAGFTLPGAHLYRPLVGQSIEVTTRKFASWLQFQLTHADISIG
ncbi:MAG TPA: 6-phosphogluconolactonase, partial [Candidatus Saccharimonadales bacterium]|nr:6-phosphogluconolactonase [Candidatus Saccharimonadales bacterium]